MNATIIYYSSNKEDPGFEGRVRDTLLKNCGGLPIVSVTQKPIELGTNICVGDVGASGFNMFRQVQIALENCDTEFVISAEADCIYPPDYFTFKPPRDNTCFRSSSLYVMPDKRDFYFYKKEGATHAQIVGREFYLKRLNELFKGAPEWSVEEKNFPKERWKKEDIFDEITYFKTDPIVQIKTHKAMRYFTHSDRTPILSIPCWGAGKELRLRYVQN